MVRQLRARDADGSSDEDTGARNPGGGRAAAKPVVKSFEDDEQEELGSGFGVGG